MQIKPIVDGLEDELAGRLQVIRVDVQSPSGKELAAQMDYRFTPTFIYFDAEGVEQWREVGRLAPGRVRQSIP